MQEHAEDIYARALEFEPNKREQFIVETCGTDEALLREVREMLADHEGVEKVFGFSRATTISDSEGGSEIAGACVEVESEGDRVGPYILRQIIGEGGFGLVWMAEQSEPISRMVALKVVKAGMDTKQVLARFEAERQALAMMDHPNIAQVLDAGATEGGRPYFAMELVKGIPITKFCEDQKHGVRQRLEIFKDVCAAVNHAHQKGIIHRDLKPSNVMVTLHGDKPVVKVIDFGIAKATHSKLTEKTLFTRFEQFLGTPVYMSPEQAAMSGLDVDTRSDIYSLGVLLYELLAGAPPFDAKSLLSAGYDEMRRIIREEEPPKPSTRLTQTQSQTAEAGPTRKFHVEAGALKGELDWIVMKAIDKDRSRRYETASAFAQDVGRFLDDEPVQAGAPTAGYKFRKFARRHKASLGVAVMVVLLLLAGIVATSWQAVRATNAMTIADEKRAEAEAVSAFLTGMFESARPDGENSGREVRVADILDEAVEKLEDDLAPSTRAALQATLGKTYEALGLYNEGTKLLETARDYYEKTLGATHRDTLGVLHNLATCYSKEGREEEAMRLREMVLDRRIDSLGKKHVDTLNSMYNMAVSHAKAGNIAEATLRLEEVLKLRIEVLPENHRDIIMSQMVLGIVYFQAGRLQAGIEVLEESLPRHRSVLGDTHPNTLSTMENLATAYEQVGRHAEALKLREEVMAIIQDPEVLGPNHPDTIKVMSSLAESYEATEQHAKAMELHKEALRLCRDSQVLGPGHPQTWGVMAKLAKSYHNAGRFDEAIALGSEVVEVYRSDSRPGLGNALLVSAMDALAESLVDANRFDRAIPVLEEALVKIEDDDSFPRERRETKLEMLENLVICYDKTGREAEAGALRKVIRQTEVEAE